MSSLSELVKKRLSQVKRGEDNGRDRENSSSFLSSDTGIHSSSGINSHALLASRDYEGARADLRTACILYVRARKYLYPGYMEKAFLVFGVLLDEEVASKWFGSYCLEPYPDVCYCGAEFVSNHGGIRSHCSICRGQVVGLGYDMQRLSQELGIHYSWIEYGFAWALSKVGGVKVWLS